MRSSPCSRQQIKGSRSPQRTSPQPANSQRRLPLKPQEVLFGTLTSRLALRFQLLSRQAPKFKVKEMILKRRLRLQL